MKVKWLQVIFTAQTLKAGKQPKRVPLSSPPTTPSKSRPSCPSLAAWYRCLGGFIILQRSMAMPKMVTSDWDKGIRRIRCLEAGRHLMAILKSVTTGGVQCIAHSKLEISRDNHYSIIQEQEDDTEQYLEESICLCYCSYQFRLIHLNGGNRLDI